MKHVKVGAGTHVKTPGSDSVSCQPLESSSPDILECVVRTVEVELTVDALARRVRGSTCSAHFLVPSAESINVINTQCLILL